MASVGDRITHIRVINRNPFPIMDRYDGTRYIFPPMEKVTIPADVASHIFGYNEKATEEDMFKHVQKRFGWNTFQMVQSEQDRMYFDALDIKPVIYQLIEVPLDEAAEHKPALTAQEEPSPMEMRRRKSKGGRRKYKRSLSPTHDLQGHPLDISQPVDEPRLPE